MAAAFRVRLTAVLPLLALAGCGLPAGMDGDLVGDWATMPEPELMLPEAGVCVDAIYQSQPRLGSSHFGQVACTGPHQIETVHVGTFEGEAAERGSPPNRGTAQWSAAYEECDSAAADYLGADFRSGRLWLGVAVPIDAAWEAGARWFRCDLLQVDRHDNFLNSTQSWRNVFAGESEVSLGCFTVDTREVEGSDYVAIEEMEEVSCTEPHQAEFVGVWRAEPEARYPRGSTGLARVSEGCLERVAEYVDVPDDESLQFRSGVGWWFMSPEDWDNGDRGIRCFLWVPDELSRSLEGAGEDGLPVQVAGG